MSQEKPPKVGLCVPDDVFCTERNVNRKNENFLYRSDISTANGRIQTLEEKVNWKKQSTVADY